MNDSSDLMREKELFHAFLYTGLFVWMLALACSPALFPADGLLCGADKECWGETKCVAGRCADTKKIVTPDANANEVVVEKEPTEKACVCKPGELRCKGEEELQVCRQDCTGWAVQETCGKSEARICKKDKCICKNQCEKEQSVCKENDERELCEKSIHGCFVLSKEKCSSGNRCKDGRCCECEPGTKQCVDVKRIRTCKKDCSGWERPKDCKGACKGGSCKGG